MLTIKHRVCRQLEVEVTNGDVEAAKKELRVLQKEKRLDGLLGMKRKETPTLKLDLVKKDKSFDHLLK